MAKRKYAAVVTGRWSIDTEELFVRFWKDHPCLYDVSSREYHDRLRKESSWREIAEALQQPVEEVQTKAASLRTQYGKLIRVKHSGSGKNSVTARQKWIMSSLDFLRPHVIQRPTQTTFNMDNLQPTSASPDTAQDSDDQQTEEEELSDSMSSTLRPSTLTREEPQPTTSPSTSLSTSLSTPSPVVSCGPVARKAKQKTNNRGSDDFEAEKIAILKSVSQTLLGASQDADEIFGRQVACELKHIKDPATKMRLRRSILLLIYDAFEAEQEAVLGPQLYSDRADVQQLLGSKEGPHPEQEEEEESHSLDQEDTELLCIKEEQEELWSSQEEEQLQGLEETDTTEFPYNIVPVKRETEEKPESSDILQRGTEQMETGADRGDFGGAESDTKSDRERHVPESGVKIEDSSEPETDDSDYWKETREYKPGLSCADNKDKSPKADQDSRNCSFCNKIFDYKSQLTTHMLVHTGEKPFSCSVCSEKFSQKAIWSNT